ncbi:MAG TPA: peptidylprolyl isomerase [Brumimicrobium sp.]|nr:peptidylprolyl isomerase [Brumimicrobium sp.]
MSQVKKNDQIKVHYTGKLTNGEVFDSSVGREPLEFTVGAGQMIPGFDTGVLDMKLNEKKVIEIPSAEAYGEKREDLMQEVPKIHLPQDMQPEVGMQLMAQLPDGGQQPLVVTEVKEETIIVDANHPLAGKDLVFEVEVVEIK